MKIKQEVTENYVDQALNKLGLETYDGCAGPLLESVLTEFGEQFAIDVFRGISDDEAKWAVYTALINNSII